MYRSAEVPTRYRKFFFVNAGGPVRAVVSRENVGQHWQLVTLDCGDTVLRPRTQQAGTVCCGFCGGMQPLTPE